MATTKREEQNSSFYFFLILNTERSVRNHVQTCSGFHVATSRLLVAHTFSENWLRKCSHCISGRHVRVVALRGTQIKSDKANPCYNTSTGCPKNLLRSQITWAMRDNTENLQASTQVDTLLYYTQLLGIGFKDK